MLFSSDRREGRMIDDAVVKPIGLHTDMTRFDGGCCGMFKLVASKNELHRRERKQRKQSCFAQPGHVEKLVALARHGSCHPLLSRQI